jgi:hypothetical protein
VKALRFLIPILIAVVLGPLIAGVAVSLFAVGNSIFNSEVDATVLGMFPVYIMLAYAVGAPIALLAGLMVSIWMLARAPNLIVEVTNAHSNFLFTLAAAVVAAAGCWLLTRRFARTA